MSMTGSLIVAGIGCSLIYEAIKTVANMFSEPSSEEMERLRKLNSKEVNDDG